jgi:hypothetical protein
MRVSHGETGQSGDGIESPPAPDFGLALKTQGCSPTARLDFPFFHFDELGVLGPGQYTIMMMMSFGAVPHALGLDFGSEILPAMLALAPPAVRTVITKELARDGRTPRRIALPAPIRCGISATLGEPKTTVRESFLPLVVRAVYPAWDEAPGKPGRPELGRRRGKSIGCGAKAARQASLPRGSAPDQGTLSLPKPAPSASTWGLLVNEGDGRKTTGLKPKG